MGGPGQIGCAAVNNPLRILESLDRHLRAPAEINLFGRSALALGYARSPALFAATEDVDAILPLGWLAEGDQHIGFWEAQQRTNAELESEGLYLTHLFREVDVILRPDWLRWRVQIPLAMRHLQVFRPATLDLILTKMARADANDLADIRFLLEREPVTRFRHAKVSERQKSIEGWMAVCGASIRMALRVDSVVWYMPGIYRIALHCTPPRTLS